jgi:hypothetical protein
LRATFAAEPARDAHRHVVAFLDDVDHAVDQRHVQLHLGILAHELGPQRRQVQHAKAERALMRSTPCGCMVAEETMASASATSSRMDLARSNSASPLEVSDILRELRFSRRVCRWASRSLM